MAGELKRLENPSGYMCDNVDAIRTALDLLSRAAVELQEYEDQLSDPAITKWLADYRAAKGE